MWSGVRALGENETERGGEAWPVWLRGKVDGITSVQLEQAICERQALSAPIKHYWRHGIWLARPLVKGLCQQGWKRQNIARYFISRSGPRRGGGFGRNLAAQCRHPWAHQTGNSIIRPPAKNPQCPLVMSGVICHSLTFGAPLHTPAGNLSRWQKTRQRCRLRSCRSSNSR